MNTKVFYDDLDDRLEGEDAADALFALLLKEPSPELDARILELATLAINAEQAELADDDFMAMEAKADALFASLMLDPPAMLDSRILDMAYEAIEEEAFDTMFAHLKVTPTATLDRQIAATAIAAITPVPTLVEAIVNGLKVLVHKIFTLDGPIYVHNRTYAPALAAEKEEQDQPGKRMRDCVLHGESEVDYGLPGEWSLHVGSDPSDPSHRSIRLYFSDKREDVYEGCTVELRQGDGSVLLSGTVEYGLIEAELPADAILGPPFTLQVQLKDVQELQP